MTTAAESRPRKAKKCQNADCRAEFVPQRMGQKACSPACAVSLVQASRAKAERKELREAKQKAKTRGDWLREAQAEFNRWVRLRDADLPCVSCGRNHEGQYHAGHFYSIGARPNLRFDERNVHKQCATCNTYLHGNLINYRTGLIVRIGLAAVEALEADQTPKHYSIEDLKAIKAEYIRKRKEIEKCS